MMNKHILLCAVLLAGGASAAPPAERLVNGGLWKDTDGVHVNAHGGGLLKDGDVWYWYGEHKIAGREGNRAYVGVGCYSSKDLSEWKNEGIALEVSSQPGHDIEKGCILERPKVVKAPATGKYVMYFHLERKGMGMEDARVGIAVADRPTGPFVFVRSLWPNAGDWPANARPEERTPEAIAASKSVGAVSGGVSDKGRENCLYPGRVAQGQMSRDMTLFVDGGTVWHVFASESNSTLHFAELTKDCLGYTGRWYRIAEKDWTEAPAVVRRGGWYWLLGSGCTGWNPNSARIYRSKSIAGPWERLGNPCSGVNPENGLGPEKTWGAQPTFIFHDDRTGRDIACFDMWRPENAVDGRYAWLPIEWNGDEKPRISWCDTAMELPEGGAGKHEEVRVLSPDSRNEIRLWLDPLSYEVKRDGVAVVEKSALALELAGRSLDGSGAAAEIVSGDYFGLARSSVYKKSAVDLAGNWVFADFGDWGVRLVARDDGVAYRFETKMAGRVKVVGETAALAVPDPNARSWVNFTDRFGCEETVPEALAAKDIRTRGAGRKMVYLPFVYATGGKAVAVTESDVYDYPVWNLVRASGVKQVSFNALFEPWPAKTVHVSNVGGWKAFEESESGGRWVRVLRHENYLVETEGSRTFPWRVFALADASDMSAFCEADIVWALARPQSESHDFSWVKPGKVSWDWWNGFDNIGYPEGCTTKTYERFIDFAARTGVEYVILDEGWSESLNVWKYRPEVDVPHLVEYANGKGVGIVLWMAWAQAVGEEARVVEHFAKLGAKGFKVDFMDRGDAECERFLWKFAEECRKAKMIVDYHGVHRPTGLSRSYPNVVNYEGVHGLEQTKWYEGAYDFMANDVRQFYLRMTAGQMDYTPGAMDNYATGDYRGNNPSPGSVGTRCHQMALMALYEAPLQMLCDSPTKYEKNMECFEFMSKTPVVWDATVGLGGCPESFAAVARRAKDGSWYAAGITDRDARDFEIDTSFLGGGEWKAEMFRDAGDAPADTRKFVHEKKSVKAGEKIPVHMAPGGGFVVRFAK